MLRVKSDPISHVWDRIFPPRWPGRAVSRECMEYTPGPIWKSFYCPHSHDPANMKQIGAVLAMLRLFPCAAPGRRHVLQ